MHGMRFFSFFPLVTNVDEIRPPTSEQYDRIKCEKCDSHEINFVCSNGRVKNMFLLKNTLNVLFQFYWKCGGWNLN